MTDSEARNETNVDHVKRGCVVSFSGIDGAGKTTQIDAIAARLRAMGLRVRLIRFWDDVACFRRLREESSHKIFKSERGIGTPEKPVQRRDKNVHTRYMTSVRLLVYALDTARLGLKLPRLKRDSDVVIFDRYIYDELANLETRNLFVRAYSLF